MTDFMLNINPKKSLFKKNKGTIYRNTCMWFGISVHLKHLHAITHLEGLQEQVSRAKRVWRRGVVGAEEHAARERPVVPNQHEVTVAPFVHLKLLWG